MSEKLTEALDRGYRDWAYGDPLHMIDLSALDVIIEAATQFEGANDPTDAYLRRMAGLHPDWRPLDVLRSVLDALLVAQESKTEIIE